VLLGLLQRRYQEDVTDCGHNFLWFDNGRIGHFQDNIGKTFGLLFPGTRVLFPEL
jgi:hypothetical protein